jgi:hypothetical protein
LLSIDIFLFNMSQSASEKLSQRWGSRRQENNSRGRSNWGSNKNNNLLEKLVTVDESVVGRIIGTRGANIQAMEQEISSREGGMCRIHSVRGVKGGTFLVKGSHARILEVAEQWLLKYQQQSQSQPPNERHAAHMRRLEQQEKQNKQEAEKLRLSKIAPDINTQNFPSFSSTPKVDKVANTVANTVASETASGVASETASETANTVANKVASETANTVANKVASETASETANTVANTVANKVASETASETASGVASETASGVANTVASETVAVAKETPKWGDCGSLRNAVQGLSLAQKQKKTQEPTEKWYPDSMVLLPLEKPVSFYDH